MRHNIVIPIYVLVSLGGLSSCLLIDVPPKYRVSPNPIFRVEEADGNSNSTQVELSSGSAAGTLREKDRVAPTS